MGDKRLRAMKIVWKNMKIYFVNFIFQLTTFPVFAVIIYFLWKTILANSSISISLNEIITYYILVYAVQMMINQRRTARKMSEDVRTGNIVKVISRPMDYLYYNFWKRFGTFVFFVILYSITLIVINYFFTLQIATDPTTLIFFAISILFAMIMNFMTFFVIGITAFWTTSNWGIINSFAGITSFLAGAWIPLELLGGTLKEVAFLLPFRFTAHFPVSILQGKLTMMEIVPQFGLMIFWTIMFYLIAKLAWKVGEKQLTGFGV